MVGVSAGVAASLLMSKVMFKGRMPSDEQTSHRRWLMAALDASLPAIGGTIAFNASRKWQRLGRTADGGRRTADGRRRTEDGGRKTADGGRGLRRPPVRDERGPMTALVPVLRRVLAALVVSASVSAAQLPAVATATRKVR
jgi:hypothetical protein